MKSIKDRHFYVVHKNGRYTNTFIGIWDNPSVVHRDVKDLAEKFAKKNNSTVTQNNVGSLTQFVIADLHYSYTIVKTKIYDAKMQTG